jgi:hypothetical protein
MCSRFLRAGDEQRREEILMSTLETLTRHLQAIPLATDTFVIRGDRILVQTFAMLAPAGAP